jgi:alpha,alpha-trehalose-phosphate synthase [UDP-forming]
MAVQAREKAVSPTVKLTEPLIVVTNREPYAITGNEKKGYHLQKTTGGLVTALEPVLKKQGGLWVSWEGNKPLTDEQREVLRNEAETMPFNLAAVPLSRQEIKYYYNGFANDLLWPLFHYFLSRANFSESRNWPNYVSANRKFADVVLAKTSPTDWTWVHDYQLLLVPQMVREASPHQRIGFFNHIPFPSYELFRTLPYRREILRGLLGSDLVGFHTDDYARHFMKCVDKLLPTEARVDSDNGLIYYDGRAITVQAFPISIDVDHIQSLAAKPESTEKAKALRQQYDAMGINFIGVGVDRLDYTKGILERLEALEAFFAEYPEFKKKVSFVQICSPTRTAVGTYQELSAEVEQAVGRINGRLAEGTWSPIQFFSQGISQEELIPYFLASDFCMVTPLRDGMNLVAKEYCATQLENRGALIVSELAGASSEMNEAFVVNPFSQHRMVEALHKVMTLPSDEKQQRMATCRQQVESVNIHTWVNDYLHAFRHAVVRREAAQHN